MPYKETTNHFCQNKNEKRVYKNMQVVTFKVYLEYYVF